MRFFSGGHFEFSKSTILIFFLLHISEKPSPFIWGFIFFCTMDVFSRILEKNGGGLLCTRLYISSVFKSILFWITKTRIHSPIYRMTLEKIVSLFKESVHKFCQDFLGVRGFVQYWILMTCVILFLKILQTLNFVSIIFFCKI